MIKKSILVLILTLLTLSATGCAERGANVSVPVKQQAQQKNIETKDKAIPTLKLRNSRENKVQKAVSGSFILIIGLILFL